MISKNEARKILDYDIVDILDLLKKINIQRSSHEITYSKNVFLPLTHICQNNCGYCTFKQTPGDASYILMNEDETKNLLTQAQKYNCTEALYTFGENADTNNYVKAKLDEYGYETMVDYLYHLCEVTLNKYNILPHTNMGIIDYDDLYKLSQVNASMGLMLETTNRKLLKTIVHKDSPGKDPKKRLNYIENAGKLNIPFTTGLLLGIGESKDDHIDSLFEIRKLQDKYGHIQEIILQNFKPKKGIAMEDHPEPEIVDLIKIVIVAKLLFNDVSIQIPPNLNRQLLPIFITTGADDVGGISPVTEDFVNPDAPWPEINEIQKQVESLNYTLKERLPVYDKYIDRKYLSKKVYDKALKLQKKI